MKRLFNLLLAASLVAFVTTSCKEKNPPVDPPRVEPQEELIEEGITGSVKWGIGESNTLYLFGMGAPLNYWEENGEFAPWMEEYREQITKVVVMEGVTAIGSDSFRNCPNIVSVEIPETVTQIGVEAFLNCSSLEEVDLPAGLVALGDNDVAIDNVFKGCTSLRTVSVPGGSITTGDATFAECSDLEEAIIEEGMRSVGNHCFASNTSLTKVTIPSSIMWIGFYAFANCPELTDVYMLATTPPNTQEPGFTIQGDTLHVPAEALDAYNESEWPDYFSSIVAIED